MRSFHYVLIILYFLTATNPIYIVTKNFRLKNFSLAKTQLHNSNRHTSVDSFIVKICNKSYEIIVKRREITNLYNNISEILFLDGTSTTKKKFSSYSFNIVEGFVRNYSNSGVRGYIKQGEFYGTIALNDKIYYVEEINRYPELLTHRYNKAFNAFIYDKDAVNIDDENKLFERRIRRSRNKNAINKAASRILYKKFIKDRHICPLLILLDNSFLKKIHNNDALSAVAQILLSINEVNSVFRSTDFDSDGIPDNIGFIIKYLVLIEHENSSFNYVPYYTKKPISPRFYLAHFAQYLILREVCLGVAFTGQSFKDNVLGVSYSAVSETDISEDIVGGICQRPFTSYMLSLNAVAVSYVSTHGHQLPQSTLDTCLTHEFGHAFGCRHDRKSDPGYSEKYIMSPHTLPGTSAENFQFSPMSKKHLIMTVPKKGYCMQKSSEPFCGNGIREPGEECDCGAKYLCQIYDPCCIQSGVHGACQVNRALGYQCHPSQGFCCNSDCKFRHLEEEGVDCELMNRMCPCENENCACGIGGRCVGNDCHSEECVRIDAEECNCPLSYMRDSCNICCIEKAGDSCLTSRNLTKLKLQQGQMTIKRLASFSSMSIFNNATEYEQFCHGTDCITIGFKKFKIGEYCLRNGNLGKCGLFGCSFGVKENSRSIEMLRSHTSAIYKQCLFLLCSAYFISIKYL